MYELVYKRSAIKDLKNIDKKEQKYLSDSLLNFATHFSPSYEQELLKSGKIKKLQSFEEDLYRLKLRSYRAIYLKEDDKLTLLVLAVKSRENSYKK